MPYLLLALLGDILGGESRRRRALPHISLPQIRRLRVDAARVRRHIISQRQLRRALDANSSKRLQG